MIQKFSNQNGQIHRNKIKVIKIKIKMSKINKIQKSQIFGKEIVNLEANKVSKIHLNKYIVYQVYRVSIMIYHKSQAT